MIIQDITHLTIKNLITYIYTGALSVHGERQLYELMEEAKSLNISSLLMDQHFPSELCQMQSFSLENSIPATENSEKMKRALNDIDKQKLWYISIVSFKHSSTT